MALPKRRQSKTRTNTRRSQWKLKRVTFGTCSQCHEPKLPHRVCPHCGSYNGREVIAQKTAE